MGTVQAAELELNQKPKTGAGRLLFIDNLRLAVITLVVVLHLAITYGPLGHWYYTENLGRQMLGRATSIFFCMFGAFVQAFSMGCLFFIAGFFVPGAYDRKGAGRFILDRLVRLGTPALVYMLLLHPLAVFFLRYYKYGSPASVIREYPHYLLSLEFLSGSGPLWFAVALLIFSLAYAGARALMEGLDARRPPTVESAGALTHGAVMALILGVAVITFLVRLVQPIGFAVMNMQFCFFTQYITLFTLGALAYRRDFLTRLPTTFGMAWFKCAILIGLPCLFAMMASHWQDLSPCFGGWQWLAMISALWESFFCAGVCLGLLVIFRDRFNAQGRLAGFLSRNAFGVYVFHSPIVVWLTLTARDIYWHPLLKFAVAAAVITPLCFAVSAAIRKIPFCARIFS